MLVCSFPPVHSSPLSLFFLFLLFQFWFSFNPPPSLVPLCVGRCPCIGDCGSVGKWLRQCGSVPFLSLLHPHSLNLPQWHNPMAEALSHSALSLSLNQKLRPRRATTSGSLGFPLYFLFPLFFSLILFSFFRCSLIYESSPFYCLPVYGFRDLIFFLGF